MDKELQKALYAVDKVCRLQHEVGVHKDSIRKQRLDSFLFKLHAKCPKSYLLAILTIVRSLVPAARTRLVRNVALLGYDPTPRQRFGAVAQTFHGDFFDAGKDRRPTFWAVRQSLKILCRKKTLEFAHQTLQEHPYVWAKYLIQTYVSYTFFKKYIKKAKPQVAVIVSDHTPVPCGFIRAAEKRGVPTVYIQHAHISESFPPLDYSLSVLEGQAALDTYKKIGPARGDVVFKGVAGDSKPFRVPDFSQGIKAGIFAGHKFTHGVQKLAEEVARQPWCKELHLRPHPAHKHHFPTELNVAGECVFHRSDCSLSAFEEAEKMDVVFVGNSSSALEVMKNGTPCIYFDDMDEIPHDYYGFVRYGLLPEVKNLAALKDLESTLNAVFDGTWPQKMAYFDGGYNKSPEEIQNNIKSAVKKLTHEPA